LKLNIYVGLEVNLSLSLVVQPDAVCEVGELLLIFQMRTWGFSVREAKQRNLYTR